MDSESSSEVSVVGSVDVDVSSSVGVGSEVDVSSSVVAGSVDVDVSSPAGVDVECSSSMGVVSVGVAGEVGAGSLDSGDVAAGASAAGALVAQPERAVAAMRETMESKRRECFDMWDIQCSEIVRMRFYAYYLPVVPSCDVLRGRREGGDERTVRGGGHRAEWA